MGLKPKTEAVAYFEMIVPPYMDMLMADFGFTDVEAAAVFGNFGHESWGFTAFQELEPVVPGSRGGFGWAMWTGPRRRDFEAYAKRNGLNIRDHLTNYKFLFNELKGPESRAVSAIKKVHGLRAKTTEFEKKFERAGVKHYNERVEWAEIALAAYHRWLSVRGDQDVVENDPILNDKDEFIDPFQDNEFEYETEPEIDDMSEDFQDGYVEGYGTARGHAWQSRIIWFVLGGVAVFAAPYVVENWDVAVDTFDRIVSAVSESAQ